MQSSDMKHIGVRPDSHTCSNAFQEFSATRMSPYSNTIVFTGKYNEIFGHWNNFPSDTRFALGEGGYGYVSIASNGSLVNSNSTFAIKRNQQSFGVNVRDSNKIDISTGHERKDHAIITLTDQHMAVKVNSASGKLESITRLYIPYDVYNTHILSREQNLNKFIADAEVLACSVVHNDSETFVEIRS